MGRYQCVRINNCLSELLPVLSGVPQGSILGPLLFIIYINDLPNSIHSSNILISAEDTKCYKHIYNTTDINLLQQDLDSLFQWSIDNHLSINSVKCILLKFKSRSNHHDVSTYSINNLTILRKQLIVRPWPIMLKILPITYAFEQCSKN